MKNKYKYSKWYFAIKNKKDVINYWNTNLNKQLK